MLSWTLPKILSNIWFWYSIIAIVIATQYLWGKPPPPPKKSAFFEKHKQTITKTADVFLVLVILLGWLSIIYITVKMALEPILKPSFIPLAEELKITLVFFSTGAIYTSGITGGLFGFLSTFQSNINKLKKIILLAISLLPVLFTMMLLLITPVKESEYFWSVIKSGFGYSLGCLVINGPAIFFNQNFIRVSWLLMRKLKLVSGEFPG
jgi:hypothetical protein